MTWSVADIPDLSGRVAVVTGANGGLGFETALALAGAGAHVVMAARNQDKARAAHARIVEGHGDTSAEIVELDLGSLDSVAEAASTITGAHEAIDILVNNAGVMAMPERRTEDGFEMQFGTNHLGHWAFTARLLPVILSAEGARVVTVTSTAHHFGRAVDPNNPNLEGGYGPWKAYGQSKLANYHFALGLQEEFERHGASAISLVAHPGLSHTDLQLRTAREGGASHIWAKLAARTGMSAAEGALPQLRAATDPAARGGEMYAPRWIQTGPPVRRPIVRPGRDEAIATLWEVSERLTGLSLSFTPESG